MGESTCLTMQPFSYVSGLPSFDPTQGNRNLVHSLGHSVSFGRFVSDSGSWEKWSVFSHNRYVEEAERYARPGSVAQKKAFFEAHYREMAARKAAADAAAAAEHEIAASDEACNSLLAESDTGSPVPALECNDPNGQNEVVETEQHKVSEAANPPVKDVQENNTMDKGVPDSTGNINKLAAVPSKSLRLNKAARQQPSTPAKSSPKIIYSRREVYATPRSNKKSTVDVCDKRKTTPKHMPASISTPKGGITRVTTTTVTRKAGSLGVSGTSSVSRNCMTPTAKVPPNGTSRNLMTTPRSYRTPNVRSAVESKSAAPKGKSPATERAPSKLLTGRSKVPSLGVSTPFNLKIIDRSAMRKEKLEEKFNANEAKEVQQQPKPNKPICSEQETADPELKRYRQTLGYKARPLPKFYKEIRMPKKQLTAKVVAPWPHSGRKPGLKAVKRLEDPMAALAGKTQTNDDPAPTNSQATTPPMNNAQNIFPNVEGMQ